MEAFAIIVLLASIVLGLFAIINLIKPLGLAKITRRRHAAGVLAGSVFLFFGAALVGAASQPGGLSAAADTSAEKGESRAGADAAPAAAAARKDQTSAGVTQIEFNAVWGGVKVVMERCDAPVRRAGEAVGTGDAYAAYPLVQRAEEDCSEAWMLMSDIDPPKSAKGDVRRAIIDAREACSTTAFVKGQAMKKLAAVVNGDSRPSAFAEAKGELERGQLASLNCVAQFAKAADAAGLVLPELQDAESTAPDGRA